MLYALILACSQAPAGISGLVTDDSGGPVARARVLAAEMGRATLYYNSPEDAFLATPGIPELEAPRFGRVTTADDGGRYSIGDLAPGEFTLLAADPRRGVAYTTTRLEAGKPSELRLVLQPPAFVLGSVRGLKHDFTLHVLELRPRASALNLQLVPRLTLEDGSWNFRSAVLPGTIEWRVVGTEQVLSYDYRATLFDVPVDAHPGEETRWSLDLDAGLAVSGRVLDEKEAPLAGVSVVARSRALPARELGTVSDASGNYRVRGLVAGTWKLDARRWTLRELPGCGNGPQELAGSHTLLLGAQSIESFDLVAKALRAAPKVGEPARDFEVLALDGRTVSLRELRGRVVLLDFWATWCGMCRVEFPKLAAAYDTLAASGRFEIVGVSIDEDVSAVRRFVASRGLRWPQTALGAASVNEIALAYNVQSTPSTVLVAADGTIAAMNLVGEELRKRIEALIAN